MAAVIFIGIFVLLALGALIAAKFLPATLTEERGYNRRETVVARPRLYALLSAFVLALIAGVIWFSNSAFNVEARTVGVVTEFGKAVDTVEPGFHFLPPWAEVTEFPTSNQNLDLDGSDGDDQGTPVPVKFDGGGTGSV